MAPPAAVTVVVIDPPNEMTAGGTVRLPPASFAILVTAVAEGRVTRLDPTVVKVVSLLNIQGGSVAVPIVFPTGATRLIRSGPRSGPAGV